MGRPLCPPGPHLCLEPGVYLDGRGIDQGAELVAALQRVGCQLHTLCMLSPEVSVSKTTTLYLLERQQGSRPRCSLPALKLVALAASPVHQMRA